MSTPKVDQILRLIDDDNNETNFSSRRSSLVVNLSSKRHQRSSVTTTTTKRRPMKAAAHSLGASFASGSSAPSSVQSPAASGRSSLDELRDRLACTEDAAHMIFASRCVPLQQTQARFARGFFGQSKDRTAFEGARSAPATLSACANKHRLVVDEENVEDNAEQGEEAQLETTATIRLATASPDEPIETLTNTNESSSSNLSCSDHIQVVELDEETGGDNETLDRDRSQPETPQPIVEVRQTSSSSSCSSAGSSPIQSRQSSNCRSAASRRTSNGSKQAPPSLSDQVGPTASAFLSNATLSSSSSSSSSTSSSRKLIRRRTVRRSYHHRALEESAEQHRQQQQQQQSQRQPLVSTTLTQSKFAENGSVGLSSSNRCRLDEPEVAEVDRSDSVSFRLGAASASTLQTNKRHQTLSPLSNQNTTTKSTQSSASKLSTSRSSSKIATITTSSSTTNHQHHHQLKKSSTTSEQTISDSSKQEHKQQQQEDMTASSQQQQSLNTTKLDLNRSNLLEDQQRQSLFERRNRSSMLAADLDRRARASTYLALEEDEAATNNNSGAVRKSSEHSTSSTSFNASSSSSLTKSTKMHQHRHLAGRAEAVGADLIPAGSAGTTSAISSSSSCETSLSRSATKKTVSTLSGLSNELGKQICEQKQANLSSSSSSHFRASSSSVFLSKATAAAAAAANRQQRSFLTSPDNLLLSSPDVRSLVQELGSDFAELENAMTASSSLTVREQFAARSTNELTSRLFGSLPPPPSSANRLAYKIEAPPSPRNEPDSLESLMKETDTTIKELENNPPSTDFSCRSELDDSRSANTKTSNDYNETKIRELMDKAQRHRFEVGNGESVVDNSKTASLISSHRTDTGPDAASVAVFHQPASACTARSPLNENEAVKGKIERIDQRMNDLCRKLEACNDTQKAIELLKIMIQTIEKAWSIPVCGDDLGFKLCNSLRQFGGLNMILSFIHEADARQLLQDDNNASSNKTTTGRAPLDHQSDSTKTLITKPAKQLKLNLSKIQQSQRESSSVEAAACDPEVQQQEAQAKDDEDSDILTSDLGLDSTTSVESLSYASAQAAPVSATTTSSTITQTPPASDDSTVESGKREQASVDVGKPTTDDDRVEGPSGQHLETPAQVDEVAAANKADEEAELRHVREEELVLLSAHLLSQCLTTENREHIVEFGLDPVIKLACRFTTMKSKQSKRLLKRSALMRQSSTLKLQQQQQDLNNQVKSELKAEGGSGNELTAIGDASCGQSERKQSLATTPTIQPSEKTESTNDDQLNHERSDLHSAIGTEILQHLFKHSEETCSRMITLGALQAILYGCRSSHVETLRHCASALANLALYGGSDSQQTMVEQKAHVWLFPLAFNEDDNVQYYACLAIVVLAANQEIEADVLKSSTLDLVEPFVTSHEPRQFAESTTSHIHGQSAEWLKKLMPLLESKREEARNLACFHFAMEAHIKREQGQTHLFKQIGSIEPLRRTGSLPIAIASKFACQALRLIGEREPHKLSQQVPLWTCEDVCEWVDQIGFDRFRPAFRDSHVDGDLLLQLDEEMLKFDIGIENGIIRKRFLRELGQLKRIADYSSVDKSNLGQLLISSTSLMSPSCTLAGHHHNQYGDSVAGGSQMLALQTTTTNSLHHCCSGSSSGHARGARDYLQYIYPIIQLGVTRDNIHLVDCDQLLAECKITNALHRIKLANSIRELQDRVILEAASNERNSLGGTEQKTLDVFVSYRRSTGSQLASLLKVHLQLRGFSVFIDVERLEAGKFDNNLLESIRQAKNFILVLSPSALDRCIGDQECKDWVHKEIVAALASNCNIIPIIDNFHWPDPEQLPEDMRSITYFNGIRWIHDYQDACVDKVERFIRGELSNSGASQTATTGCPSTISLGSGGGVQAASSIANQYQRLSGYSTSQGANVSTPSIVASTPSLCGPQSTAHQTHLNYSNSQQTTITTNRPNLDHQNAPANSSNDSTQHPLANYANPYLNCSLNVGNVNPNIRLR